MCRWSCFGGSAEFRCAKKVGFEGGCSEFLQLPLRVGLFLCFLSFLCFEGVLFLVVLCVTCGALQGKRRAHCKPEDEEESLKLPVLENISSGARFVASPALAPEACGLWPML